jgi:hypothetical protein
LHGLAPAGIEDDVSLFVFESIRIVENEMWLDQHCPHLFFSLSRNDEELRGTIRVEGNAFGGSLSAENDGGSVKVQGGLVEHVIVLRDYEVVQEGKSFYLERPLLHWGEGFVELVDRDGIPRV